MDELAPSSLALARSYGLGITQQLAPDAQPQDPPLTPARDPRAQRASTESPVAERASPACGGCGPQGSELSEEQKCRLVLELFEAYAHRSGGVRLAPGQAKIAWEDAVCVLADLGVLDDFPSSFFTKHLKAPIAQVRCLCFGYGSYLAFWGSDVEVRC